MSDETSAPPTLFWHRRDLRLGDHPGWQAALSGGGPVIPAFILDTLHVDAEYGAATLWRIGEGLGVYAAALARRGSRLILRSGDYLTALGELIGETGSRRVVWSRLHDQKSARRDAEIAAALSDEGIEVVVVNSALLFEPRTVETRSGGHYKVFTPYWEAVRGRDVPAPLPPPGNLAPPSAWPASEDVADWKLGAAMNRGAAVVARHAVIGEDRARARLEVFVEDRIAHYDTDRDRPDIAGTSGLSENLAHGEISPRVIWHAGRAAMERVTGKGPETFLKELGWREFAYHLLHHTPHIETRNWNETWASFPWRRDNEDAERWRRGMTGIPMIDAAMRELWVTGTMHNRCRMLVASFLTKHLMTDWRVGAEWFRQCLIDWDPASNALGWQWTAGCGPDSAPFFRIFNPEIQAAKFDPDGGYRARFLAENQLRPHPEALAYFEAVPRSWGLQPDQDYPEPVVHLGEGRQRALAAYQGHGYMRI